MMALFHLPANGGAEFLALCRKGHNGRSVVVRFDNSHHSSVRESSSSARQTVSCLSQSRLHTVNKNEVRARIWSAAMPRGKKWSITGQIYGDGSPAVKPNTKKTRLVCIVCIVLQWCMCLLYVYNVMHSVINGCKLCMRRISSWLSKYETMFKLHWIK